MGSVSRLAIDVVKDDLVKYLEDSGVKADCVELQPKYNTYKSFKVGVSSDVTSTIMNAEFWPSGTLVREFVSKNDSVFSRTFLGKR